MAFDPSISRAASHDGVNASRAPYADGSAGTQQSLDAMAQKMREGRLDPAVMGWARGCLKSKGLDGRDGITVRQQVGAILECLREQTIYAPDASGAEVVSSAAATLCLRPHLCINGGDCDDLSVALGSATLSIGIPTAIVKQNYGGEHQEHVLIACADEQGNWFYADPSTNWPLGKAANAVDEVWVDPLGAIGNLPEAHAEIVTLGRPHMLGATLSSTWQLVTGPNGDATGAAVHVGTRYRMGVLLNLTAMGITTGAITADQVKTFFSQDWTVESAAPTGDVTGGVQSWVVQGIAKTEGTIQQSATVTTSALAIEVPPSPTALQQSPPAPPGLSLGDIATAAAIVAIVGGIGIAVTRRRR